MVFAPLAGRSACPSVGTALHPVGLEGAGSAGCARAERRGVSLCREAASASPSQQRVWSRFASGAVAALSVLGRAPPCHTAASSR